MATPLRSAREPSSWWTALRPARWPEALLVLAPLVFAGLLADTISVRLAAQAALAFLLVAAAGDAFGVAAVRRSLPIASLATGCALAGLALATWTQHLAPPLGTYGVRAVGPLGWASALLALSVVDSLLLRMWVPADALAVASGYVLRAAGGAAALQLLPSRWLVLCSFLLGLFVGLGRHGWKPDPDARRPGSRRPGAQRMSSLVGALAVAAFVIYSLQPETQASVGSRDLLWTAPLVALLVARHREHIRLSFGRDPLELLLRDRLALGTFLLWIAAVLFVVYRRW
jgi:hypothetical protein